MLNEDLYQFIQIRRPQTTDLDAIRNFLPKSDYTLLEAEQERFFSRESDLVQLVFDAEMNVCALLWYDKKWRLATISNAATAIKPNIFEWLELKYPNFPTPVWTSVP